MYSESTINWIHGSFLEIHIRLSIVCARIRFFRDLLCSAAPATVRCRLGGLRTSSWSWTRLKMHGFIHGRAIPGAQHSRYAHHDEFLTFSSGLCVYATMWWTRGRVDLLTCWKLYRIQERVFRKDVRSRVHFFAAWLLLCAAASEGVLGGTHL